MKILNKTSNQAAIAILGCAAMALGVAANQAKHAPAGYTVLTPLIQDNLTVFPVVTNAIHDTHEFLTLDEGIRSGEVVIAEEGGGVMRPLPSERIPRDFPRPGGGAEVNRLTLTNNSERPLLLLAGEIVTGGKQDRVVGADRIISPKSGPIDLGVFCVEPHRWMGASSRFGALGFSMAQPSVRSKAMADKNQSAVWDEVAKSRSAVAMAVPAPAAGALSQTSSYAATMQNRFVQDEVNSVAAPVERSYDKLLGGLRTQHAVGAVVAVDGQIVWEDIFASPALFEAYWPKLIRSYAAEAVAARTVPSKVYAPPSVSNAQAFLDDMNARSETSESEPNLYRNTELRGDYYEAFILTSLLPGTAFDVHVAKMRN